MRSSDEGAVGWRLDRGGGSPVMMLEMSDAGLPPENAFLPVTIS
jgi:hypothetical protein